MLGEESLAAEEPIAAGDQESTAAPNAREPDDESPPAVSARPIGSPVGARRFAVLGLGAVTAATLGALELSSSPSVRPQPDQTFPLSSLVKRPARKAPAPTAQPAPPRPRVLKPEPRPRPTKASRRPREIHQSESEREPTATQAPVGSPVATPEPPPQASPAQAALPPSPPPPSPRGAGGSAGREDFGFER